MTKVTAVQRITRLVRPAAASVLLLFAFNASAGPVLTYGGLEWLKLTDTRGLSVADALSDNPGYRHATDVEVKAMWFGRFGISLGVNLAGNWAPDPSPLGAGAFMDVFGCTVNVPACNASTLQDALGILFDGGAGSPYGTGDVKNNDVSMTGNATIGLASLHGLLTGASGLTQRGHYLVKDAAINPVPEPAALALLGIGLAGLGFMRRRKA